MDIKEIALKVAEESGAVGYSPAPLRAVRGYSFTYEQLQNFAEALIESYKAELLKEEVERLKGIKNVQLDIYPNDAGTKQQRELDGSLEMGQLLADSKNEETSNPKAERAKSLVWMHTGGGHIADSSGKRIGIFSGDFKHRDRLICAVNSESDILAQLAAAQEEIERLKEHGICETCGESVLVCRLNSENMAGGAMCDDCVIASWKDRATAISLSVMSDNAYHDQLTKVEQLWQVDQGRCEMVEFKLTDENINELQVESIRKTIERCKRAHMTDIHIRINGKWEVVEADWIKHMKEMK